ncbi:hypothetical protein [Halobacteriovorax sp. HLS]|uniref:hypothetical protein n=1 Tax=Halobacteriovorax sp. HLS TaxID=2234000 RepID=UPI000FD7D5F3|nr:hypothetical protein [Halobacteriovorax sp. HLS]
MNIEDIKKTVCLELDNLKNDVMKVNASISESYRFKITNLSKLEGLIKETKLKFPKNITVVYIFGFIKMKDSVDVYKVYKEDKLKKKSGCSTSLVPKEYFKTKSLYVGSSQNISARLRNHFGLGKGNSTYSLHLRKVYKKELELTLEIISLANASNDSSQIIEDTISKHYRPLLGKRGGL